MIAINDIVRFKKPNPSYGSKFCFDRGLTGKVVGQEAGSYAVDFGLYYNVYGTGEHLELVAKQDEAPPPE